MYKTLWKIAQCRWIAGMSNVFMPLKLLAKDSECPAAAGLTADSRALRALVLPQKASRAPEWSGHEPPQPLLSSINLEPVLTDQQGKLMLPCTTFAWVQTDKGCKKFLTQQQLQISVQAAHQGHSLLLSNCFESRLHSRQLRFTSCVDCLLMC